MKTKEKVDEILTKHLPSLNPTERKKLLDDLMEPVFQYGADQYQQGLKDSDND
jgi:hypothetical protein